MFESFQQTDVVARTRAAAVAPLVAFLIAQFYFSLYSLLTRVPPLLFWTVDAIVLAGAIAGIVMLVRAFARHRRELDFRAIAWLIAAVVFSALCALLFVSLTFPWI